MLTKLAMQGSYKPRGGFLPLSLVYAVPDARRRDADNMHAASKAQLDGIALALGIDDRCFRPILVDWVYGSPPGALIVGVDVKIMTAGSIIEEVSA